jgi:hypothetical protein
MKHRAEAQVLFGQTEKQKDALKLGRVDNYRLGFKHNEETKQKITKSVREFWKAHPEKALERVYGGKEHYGWKGGVSDLNLSIRHMTENRKWMDEVKERDEFRCVRCGSEKDLETHHISPLADLLEKYTITNNFASPFVLVINFDNPES